MRGTLLDGSAEDVRKALLDGSTAVVEVTLLSSTYKKIASVQFPT